MKKLFNIQRVLLFMLLACFAGGLSPAWAADPVTDDFTSYSATSSGQTLGNNWYVYPGNDGSYGCFGSDYTYKHNDYDGSDYNYVSGYSSNYNKNVWLVLKKEVSGTVSFRCKMNRNTGTIYVTNKVTSVGDGTFTVDKTGAQSYSISTTASSNNYSAGDNATYIAFCLTSSDLRLLDVTYTEYEETTGPALAVKDGETKLTSPYSYSFGLATAGTTKTFTLSNPGTADLGVSVSETGNFGATLSTATIAAGSEVTLTLTMPATSGNSAVTITPESGSGIDPFVINVSGTIRDANKIYETLSSKPEGWTTSGTWSFNSTSGATTTAWYLSGNARLCTPLLTVADNEVFIFEAKGNYDGYHALQVEYSTDGENWTASETSITMTSDWQTVTISDIPAGNKYIALHTAYSSIRNFYGGEVVSGANFAINTDGSVQDFGSVKFNATAEKTYTITNSGNATMTVSVAIPDGFEAEVTKTSSIKFTNNKSWGAVKAYAWNSSNEDLTAIWPGDDVEYVGKNDFNQDIYRFVIPEGAVGIIFNNDNNGSQTVNITDFAHEGYYVADTQDSEGHWNATAWSASQNVSFTIDSNETGQFKVAMKTDAAGTKSGNVVITNNSLNKTSFTIPCSGTVLDPNYLIVDFEDSTFPEGWQVGADWSAATGTAVQSNTTTASALVTTPLTVAENETLTFKVARNVSGQGNVTSLKIRYSANGGATWSAYADYTPDGTGLSSKTLTGVPAGTVILEFLGSNIKLDDIEGFLKTTKPALAITESGVSVANNDTKDFGYLNENSTATYTVKNIGNATLNAAISGEGVTVSPANISVAAGETANITVTMAYGEPYGERTGMTMTVDSEDAWIGDFVVNFEANLVDPTAFVEDFSGNAKPAGWYSEGWTYANGVATVNSGSEQPMITEKIGAEDGKNTLTFKAYSDGSVAEMKVLNVYTSADRKTWSDANVFNLTSSSASYNLNLANGDQYIKFGGHAATIEEIKGVKKLDAPAHDLFLVSATQPTDDITPIDTYTAKVKVASLRANETVAAELFFGDDKVGELTEQLISNGATVELTLTGKAPATGTFDVYAKVYNNDVNVETEKVSVTVADKTELSLTDFAAVSTSVTADNDNNFTAEFNVTVKNTGSTAFTADQVSVTVTDGNNNPYETATWTPGETIYLKAGNYTADNANMAIYRWNEGEANSAEWALFTTGSDGIYTASLNGKNDFIICRTNPAVPVNELSFENGVWTQSNNLTTAAGVVFENNGYENNKLNLAQSNNFIAGMSATINVSVTASAGNGGEFEFNAQENVSDTFWYPTLGNKQYVNVTAAPVIVLNENSSSEIATGSNRKVRLNHSFVAGWNTICVPFAISDLSVFGNEAVAYSFDGYDTTTKELTFNKATTLNAGKPYVIYVPAAITEALEFTGVTIETANTTAGASTYNGLSFQGTYAPVTFSAIEGDQWGLTAAGKIAKASGTATMKGFRGYFTGLDLSNARMVFLGDESTGIRTITVDGNAVEGTYNLQGQKVESLKQGGLYIINGKKVVMK